MKSCKFHLVTCSLVLATQFTVLEAETPPYAKLLALPDVRPGLVVVLPCAEVASARALTIIGTGVVHGLTLDAGTLDKLRRDLLSRKEYGRVSLDLLPKGQLPYDPAIANAVIVEDAAALERRGIGWPEILRVTAPFGVIFVRNVDVKSLQTSLPDRTFTAVAEAAGWSRVTIPYPAEMDEWTQSGYDALGTMQSKGKTEGITSVYKGILLTLENPKGVFDQWRDGVWGRILRVYSAVAKGALYAFDAITGAPREMISLPSPPVFESLSAGQHGLFVATRSSLCCLGQP